MASTITSGVNRMRSAITPICANLSKQLKNISMIVLVVLIIATILFLGAYGIIYQNAHDSNITPESKTKREKTAQTLASFGVIAVILGTALNGWISSIAAKQVNQCLKDS